MLFYSMTKSQGDRESSDERLLNLERIAEIIVSKFVENVIAWVIEASKFNEPFVVCKDFVKLSVRFEIFRDFPNTKIEIKKTT